MGLSRSNQEWISQLSAVGDEQERAIADLRALLLRAALYSFQRNPTDLDGLSQEEILQRAEDCAQDALLAVLAHLPEFRGDSKFSTWAYKFAVNIALMAARHERWKGVSLDAMTGSWQDSIERWVLRDPSDGAALEKSAVRQELHLIIRACIEQDLTDKQRQVLILIVFNDIPMDEVVAHLGSSRNAVYKLLHDARRKLKAALKDHGFESANSIDWVESSK